MGRRELGCAFASFGETIETGFQVLLSRRRDGDFGQATDVCPRASALRLWL